MRAGVTEEEPFKLVTFFGSVQLLRWAKDNRCPWVARTCGTAASYGQLEALQWMREHDCPWNWQTCALAARFGQLGALVWAREYGCPWDAMTCYGAAINGHLDVLQWAREHDSPWGEHVCSFAVQFGHLEMLQWALENGCPCADLDVLFGVAAKSGHVEMMPWFLEQGYEVSGWLCAEATGGSQSGTIKTRCVCRVRSYRAGSGAAARVSCVRWKGESYVLNKSVHLSNGRAYCVTVISLDLLLRGRCYESPQWKLAVVLQRGKA